MEYGYKRKHYGSITASRAPTGQAMSKARKEQKKEQILQAPAVTVLTNAHALLLSLQEPIRIVQAPRRRHSTRRSHVGPSAAQAITS